MPDYVTHDNQASQASNQSARRGRPVSSVYPTTPFVLTMRERDAACWFFRLRVLEEAVINLCPSSVGKGPHPQTVKKSRLISKLVVFDIKRARVTTLMQM